VDFEYDDQELTIDTNGKWTDYHHDQALEKRESHHRVQAEEKNDCREDPEEDLDENRGDHKFEI